MEGVCVFFVNIKDIGNYKNCERLNNFEWNKKSEIGEH